MSAAHYRVFSPSLREGEREGVGSSVLIGAFEPMTLAMGPGPRACIWVRGCPMRCKGCITSEFISRGRPKHARAISEICVWLDRAIAERGVTGISFSGGEPFAQAEALTPVACHAHSRGLSTLSWSGFTRRHLEGPRAPVGARAFLAALDVLIDGPFIQRRVNRDPLRGSSNQFIHLLTDRHRPEEFKDSIVEVRIGASGRTVTTGVMDYAATNAALALLGIR
ncbi:MAG: 4Fe-4S single cluster domain-containing protein [Candidatus Uhrbacteria bacterium]